MRRDLPFWRNPFAEPIRRCRGCGRCILVAAVLRRRGRSPARVALRIDCGARVSRCRRVRYGSDHQRRRDRLRRVGGGGLCRRGLLLICLLLRLIGTGRCRGAVGRIAGAGVFAGSVADLAGLVRAVLPPATGVVPFAPVRLSALATSAASAWRSAVESCCVVGSFGFGACAAPAGWALAGSSSAPAVVAGAPAVG